MQTFSFEVTPWHATHVKRVLELPVDHTVEQLHLAIQRAFDLDNQHHYAFFFNNELWDEAFGYGGQESHFHDARSKRLGELSLIPKKRFLYLFDFEEELKFEVRVQRAGLGRDGQPYPRVVSSTGDPPPQYGEDDHEHAACHHADLARPELVMLAYRIKPYVVAWDEEIMMCEADDEDGEEEEIGETRAILRLESRVLEEFEAANDLLGKSRCDPRVIHANVEHALQVSPWPWLVDLPDRLDEAGHSAKAFELAERLLVITAIDPLIFRIPVYLARAGRMADARERLQSNLENYPEESRMLLDAGDALVQLSDETAAEHCYDSALTFAGATLALRQGAMQRLMMLLERQQRHTELERLLRQELAIAEAKLRETKEGLES